MTPQIGTKMELEPVGIDVENRINNSAARVRKAVELLTSDCGCAAHVHVVGASYISQRLFRRNLDLVVDQNPEACFRQFDCNQMDGSGRVLLDLLIRDFALPPAADFESFSECLDADRNTQRRIAVLYNADSLQQFAPSVLESLFAVAEDKKDRFRVLTIASSRIDFRETPEIFTYLKKECLANIQVGMDAIKAMYNVLKLHIKEPHDLQLILEHSWEEYRRKNESMEKLNRDGWMKIIAESARTLFDHPPIQGVSVTKIYNMPILTQFLITASYCASYNLPKTDLRFFTKGGVKQKRTEQSVKADNSKSAHELGPKPFTLVRLRQMYMFLADVFSKSDSRYKKLDVTSQIPNLVTAGLITRTSAEKNLTEPKFVCQIDLEAAKAVAKSLHKDFELELFLADFAPNN
ncbi:hypothetical protein L596_007072 [Steinernema carpocapsae]|uniref:Origin recognition complex subunit 5 C-terminal domain-containing protein n=1 Tax=Steinernema carpocapsae TaxID=34508 RepID=A0A4U5P836_STECR|nr:hypothetical protein L596_007072 [Steinernema carpocapsae]